MTPEQQIEVLEQKLSLAEARSERRWLHVQDLISECDGLRLALAQAQTRARQLEAELRLDDRASGAEGARLEE